MNEGLQKNVKIKLTKKKATQGQTFLRCIARVEIEANRVGREDLFRGVAAPHPQVALLTVNDLVELDDVAGRHQSPLARGALEAGAVEAAGRPAHLLELY